jgi:thioester reductase-like protein
MSDSTVVSDETTLVTGYPSFTARRMAERLVERSLSARVFVLVHRAEVADAERLLERMPSDQRSRIELLVGDVSSIDLGLSGGEYRRLQAEVRCIYHMAGRYHLGQRRESVERINVGGTRVALELALECERLRRFCFWSTIHVSGDRQGVVMEEELCEGQTFRNAYEQSKFAAEKVVRQMSRRVPCTVLRPGIIVGDSKTGEIDRYDGPYHLLTVLINGPFDLQLPMPGRGDGPLHLVPIDFVVDAALELSGLEQAVSKTYHLVDPAPLSAKSIFHLVAEKAQRKRVRASIPSPIAKTMLKLPLPWVGELKGSPKTIMESFNQQVLYNARNALEALRHTDIWCPPVEYYVDNLVRFAKRAGHATEGLTANGTSDPLG